MYREEGGRIFVFASKGGHTAHPHWYLNVMANPDVTVEIGDRSFRARAVEVTGDERDEIFARQAKDWPAFGKYQRDNPRTIPVVELVEGG
jgi:deazaflavin-dependent oxidoreductase (nitroreductase family)